MLYYAIGDVQGCLDALHQLLNKINYSPNTHILWFCGDLINRGPDSLETLRFIKSLPLQTVSVLGNHDLALIATSMGARELGDEDTFQDILQAPDKIDLIEWLRHLPLIHHEPHLNYTLAHAGIYPTWSLEKSIQLANEVTQVLKSEQCALFMQYLYGDSPSTWDDELKEWERLRFIVNAFTRMRYCLKDGSLNFSERGKPQDSELIPWFNFKPRAVQNSILFGHWASLEGECNESQVHALDTGCVWGKALTAFCLNTQERICVNCS